MLIPLIVLPGTDGLQAAPGFARTDVEDEELRQIGAELFEMALDLAGIVDPTPFCDGMSSLLAVSQGRWLDAAMSGAGMLPYIGDLAKGGKLPRYLRTFDRVAAVMERSQRARQMLQAPLEKLQVALSWLPSRGSVLIASLKQRIRNLMPHRPRKRRRVALPDVSRQFEFPRPKEWEDYIERTAKGRLGVPDRVKVHDQKSKTHKPINVDFKGDDAGHLIGARFGAPDIAENLAPQNYRINRGAYNHTIEKHWDNLLREGIGVEATVTVRIRKSIDDVRPISWHADWTEIMPDGRRISRSSDANVYYMNPHTPKSRELQKIPSTVEGQEDNLIPILRNSLNPE